MLFVVINLSVHKVGHETKPYQNHKYHYASSRCHLVSVTYSLMIF